MHLDTTSYRVYTYNMVFMTNTGVFETVMQTIHVVLYFIHLHNEILLKPSYKKSFLVYFIHLENITLPQRQVRPSLIDFASA